MMFLCSKNAAEPRCAKWRQMQRCNDTVCHKMVLLMLLLYKTYVSSDMMIISNDVITSDGNEVFNRSSNISLSEGYFGYISLTSQKTSTTHVNCTGCYDHVVLSRGWYDIAFYIYYFGLITALTLVNLCGNTAVILSILRHRQLRSPANYCLFSIACSDLSLGIIYPIYNVSHVDQPEIKRILGMIVRWHYLPLPCCPAQWPIALLFKGFLRMYS